jgi:hypothetical protein
MCDYLDEGWILSIHETQDKIIGDIRHSMEYKPPNDGKLYILMTNNGRLVQLSAGHHREHPIFNSVHALLLRPPIYIAFIHDTIQTTVDVIKQTQMGGERGGYSAALLDFTTMMVIDLSFPADAVPSTEKMKIWNFLLSYTDIAKYTNYAVNVTDNKSHLIETSCTIKDNFVLPIYNITHNAYLTTHEGRYYAGTYGFVLHSLRWLPDTNTYSMLIRLTRTTKIIMYTKDSGKTWFSHNLTTIDIGLHPIYKGDVLAVSMISEDPQEVTGLAYLPVPIKLLKRYADYR